MRRAPACLHGDVSSGGGEKDYRMGEGVGTEWGGAMDTCFGATTSEAMAGTQQARRWKDWQQQTDPAQSVADTAEK